MRDLRKDLARILDDYSHEIVYIRRNLKFRCSCYIERSGEAKSDCPKCIGTGYKIQIEKYRTRRTVSSVPETLMALNQNTGYGTARPRAYEYFMEWDTEPQDGDLILEVKWRDGIPEEIKERNFISVAQPQEGLNGRIEFWQVYCRYQPKGENDDATISSH